MIVSKYLKDRYTVSGWEYHTLTQLYYDLRDKAVKDDLTAELRELRKSGKVDVVNGMNGWLIKIINLK